MAKLSILIPSRNEEWLQKTIDDIFEHAEGDTEVIVGHDGDEPNDKPFEEIIENNIYPLKRLFVNPSIGQRAMTNKLAEMSTAKYLMKVDAHCSFSQGFDVQMMKDMDDKTILAPSLMNLHAYDWVCDEHFRTYQGQRCCDKAIKVPVWQIKPKPVMTNYVFGEDFVMKFADQQEEGRLVETMCLQGSAWMVDQETYWKWNLCDESLGSWGCQAVELGIKAYLNGGTCKTTRDAYYGHLFRGPEDFPYERGEDPGKQANTRLKELYSEKVKDLLTKYKCG